MKHTSTSKIWTPQGTVLNGSSITDETNLQEPTVIYESGSFKLWCKGGWNTPHLNYYTSSDGISWTSYGSNPLLSGASVEQPFVFKDGSTYYLYTHPTFSDPIRRYSSSDGITWTLDNSSVIPLGAGGAWDDYNFGNVFVWKEGSSDWRCIYEARSNGGVWKLGYATSSDGLSWSKYGSNPVLSEAGSVGGAFVYKDANGAYWMWVQRTVSGTTPTDISRYTSTNLTSWTRNPIENILTRSGSDEGSGSSAGQIADLHIVDVNGTPYGYFSGNPDGTSASGHSHIKLVTARVPMSQLINTSEGY